MPKFYTHKEVFNKYLLNGADLMLPGLIIANNNETINLYTFKHVNKNELYSLCLNGNDAPIAIGLTCLSGEDMYMSGMRGKCLSILHLYQDNLWSMGDRSLTVPNIPTIVAATTTQSVNSKATFQITSLSSILNLESESFEPVLINFVIRQMINDPDQGNSHNFLVVYFNFFVEK